jgi:hypothetical protein
MSRIPTMPRGTDEHGLLIDLAHRRGFVVRPLNDGGGIYEIIEKNGKMVYRGTAAEVHRWLRSKVVA